jgi:hypothetical protein
LLPNFDLINYTAKRWVWACKQIKNATPNTTPLRLNNNARLR